MVDRFVITPALYLKLLGTHLSFWRGQGGSLGDDQPLKELVRFV